MVNYNRGFIKQIEGLTLENIIEEKIGRAVERACESLQGRIKILEAENGRKDTEILRLKAQIDKNSSNSSKPPGSDGFKKIPNNCEKSGRKRGGHLSKDYEITVSSAESMALISNLHTLLKRLASVEYRSSVYGGLFLFYEKGAYAHDDNYSGKV